MGKGPAQLPATFLGLDQQEVIWEAQALPLGSSKGTGTREGKHQLPSLPSTAFQGVPCKSLPLL